MDTLLLVTNGLLLGLLIVACLADIYFQRRYSKHFFHESFYFMVSLAFLVMGMFNFFLMATIALFAHDLFIIALLCLLAASSYAWAAERL